MIEKWKRIKLKNELAKVYLARNTPYSSKSISSSLSLLGPVLSPDSLIFVHFSISLACIAISGDEKSGKFVLHVGEILRLEE
jgi:hypothetical protein